mgnify:CR=1 FL=1|tara:strand:- start:880 stop:1755 length:876 start_codon:yes stop_codon:yes gene_type:complete
MSGTRSDVRSDVRADARADEGVGGDPDALDYFARAEALGGSFDQSAINATYTTDYVKTAISNCVTGLKVDGVWDDITEAYLMVGVSFGGITAKLKHAGTAVVTNNNFVTGDYTGAGSGGGLTGDASTKYMETGLVDSVLAVDDKSLSTYAALAGANDKYFMAVRSETEQNRQYTIANIGGDFLGRCPETSATIATGEAAVGHCIMTRRADNDVEIYVNGISKGTDTSTSDAVSASEDYYLFALNLEGSAAVHSDGTMTFAHLGAGLTDAQASDLTDRVEALMDALGSGVIA